VLHTFIIVVSSDKLPQSYLRADTFMVVCIDVYNDCEASDVNQPLDNGHVATVHWLSARTALY